jgi:hypothetical protein
VAAGNVGYGVGREWALRSPDRQFNDLRTLDGGDVLLRALPAATRRSIRWRLTWVLSAVGRGGERGAHAWGMRMIRKFRRPRPTTTRAASGSG